MTKRWSLAAMMVVAMLLASPQALAQEGDPYAICYDGYVTDEDYAYCSWGRFDTTTDLGYANLLECLQHFGPQTCEQLRQIALAGGLPPGAVGP
jgi:hypothetical protein